MKKKVAMLKANITSLFWGVVAIGSVVAMMIYLL